MLGFALLPLFIFGQQKNDLLSVAYPYKQEFQKIDQVVGVEISLLKVTEESTGNVKKFCRLSSMATVQTIFGKAADVSAGWFVLTLDADKTNYLVDRLNNYYVLSKTLKPKVYTELNDMILVLGNEYLELTLHNAHPTLGAGDKWSLLLAAEGQGRKVKTDLGSEKIVNLVKALQTVSEMID